MQQANGWRASGAALGSAFSPWTTIGIRASAVVMMVELGILTSSPRLPGIGCRTAGGMVASRKWIAVSRESAGLGGKGIWSVPGDGDQRQAQVAHPLEQAVQRGLVDDGAVDGGGAVAAGGE